MQAPRKPWEKVTDGSAAGGTGPEPDASPFLQQVCLDPEFPPVEDEQPDANQTQNSEAVQP